MNFQHLQTHDVELIDEMHRLGYAETYINRHRTVIAQILGNAPKHDWQSYADVFDWYRQSYQSATYVHEIRAVIGNLEAFHLHGRFPDGNKTANALCQTKASYEKLGETYKSLVDFYSDILNARNVRESTSYSALHKSASFLFDLQCQGEGILSAVTEQGVLRCFCRDETRIRSGSCAMVVKNFLQSCIEFDNECGRIAAYIPMLRNNRKNIQYLDSKETADLRGAINNADNRLSYKDRAIGMLLLYTGIRGGDIAHLSVESIVWKDDVIRFSQQKTGQKVELPLIPIVGNAIYDYCLNERPKNECASLFLSDFAPHRELTSDGIGAAVGRLMAAAGIRQEKGDRHGTHIFRHRIVTELLDNGIAVPVISNTVGHTSPHSLESYLNADIEHLRPCSLSIEEFPVTTGVFSYD